MAASPIRVVVVTTHQEISPNLRFGRPTAEANIPAIAQVIRPGVPDQDNNLITNMMMSPGRQGHGCAGRKMREKAIGWANSLRKTFGLPLIEVDHPHPHHHHHRPPPPHHDHHDHDHPPPPPPHPFPHFPPEGPDHDFESVPTFVHPTEGVVNEEAEGGLVHILPFTGAQFDGSGRPSMPPNMPLHQGHFHHFQHLRGPFMKRLHFAIMALGPWEGRAVAFVLGMFSSYSLTLFPFSLSCFVIFPSIFPRQGC